LRDISPQIKAALHGPLVFHNDFCCIIICHNIVGKDARAMSKELIHGYTPNCPKRTGDKDVFAGQAIVSKCRHDPV